MWVLCVLLWCCRSERIIIVKEAKKLRQISRVKCAFCTTNKNRHISFEKLRSPKLGCHRVACCRKIIEIVSVW